MHQPSLRIYLFVESAIRNEDFLHAAEHRFFEHEEVLKLENEEHTAISAYTHLTGILFKISTTRHTEKEILDTFDSILSGKIPEFSNEERERFYREGEERTIELTDDLVGSCLFRKELEDTLTSNIRSFSDFVIRKSIVILKNGIPEYRETRLSPSSPLPKLSVKKLSAAGTEFHLVTYHEIKSAEELAYQTIHTEYLRTYLKNRYSKKGETYDIRVDSYNEAGCVYAWFYWRMGKKSTFSLLEEDLKFDSESFLHFRNIVAFDTQLGHEELFFSINAIVGIDPKLEFPTLERISYEGFLKFLENSNAAKRLYCR